MAIGTPVSLGTNQNVSSVNTIAISGVTSVTGRTIIVIVSTGSGATSLTVSDGTANVYTTSAAATGTPKLWMVYCANPTVALSGGTITANWSGSADSNISALQVSGLDLTSPLDKTPTFLTGGAATGMTSNLASGALAVSSELFIGVTATTGAPGTFKQSGTSPSTGDVFLNVSNVQETGAYYVSVDQRIMSATSNYNTTWANSVPWKAAGWTFKAAASAGVVNNGLLTLGAG